MIIIIMMVDIKIFSKNEKELETFIKTIRIYSQDIGMEFRIEKCGSGNHQTNRNDRKK